MAPLVTALADERAEIRRAAAPGLAQVGAKEHARLALAATREHLTAAHSKRP